MKPKTGRERDREREREGKVGVHIRRSGRALPSFHAPNPISSGFFGVSSFTGFQHGGRHRRLRRGRRRRERKVEARKKTTK